MNKVILIGRLTKTPELRYTTSNTAVCQFSIAVDRKYKSEGQPTADFINIVAWRSTAEFVSKYFNKGSRIAIVGQIQTRNYEATDGRKVYVTEVIADEVEFCESRKDSSSRAVGEAPIIAREEAGYFDGIDEAAPVPSATATPNQINNYFPEESIDDDFPFL